MPEKEGWRRFIPSWKVVAGAFGLGTLGMFALVAVAYGMTPVPAAGTADAEEEAAIFYYADGSEMARLGTTRVSVALNKVPVPVQSAVLSAENREFYSESLGFSPTGIARALYNNVKGGETQGGSGITQQLAKKYYLTDERTLTRKSKELFIAVKLEQRKSKQEILQLYLNTIYFGRGAKGIEAAARAYFCQPPNKTKRCGPGRTKTAEDLDPDEGALLAALIQAPSQYEPYGPNREQTLARYRWVLDGMVQMGKLDAASAEKYKRGFPKTLSKPSQTDLYGGQRGYMIEAAKRELERKGIPEETVLKQGLRVYTTFDRSMMEQAKQAATQTIPQISPTNKRNKRIQIGLVSVEPGTGKVRALYGGKDFLKDQVDNALTDKVQPGSSFKPLVLAAALDKGISLKSLVEGGSPRWFSNTGVISRRPVDGQLPIKNDSNGQYGVVDLVKATQNSVNTAYVQLGFKAELDHVIDIATKAGIPKETFKGYRGKAGLSLGIAEERAIDQASAYATFANRGDYAEPRVIEKVLDQKRNEFKRLEYDKDNAFSPRVAADATYAMQQVVRAGTGRNAALPGRPVAGKTGTTDKNRAAWFVGFTPQLSTAVTIFDVKAKPMVIPGQGPVSGGNFSARIWRQFMTQAMQGKEVEPFPPPQFGGTLQRFATPRPTPNPNSPDPRRQCRPGDPGFPFCPPNGTPSPGPSRPECPVFNPDCNNTAEPSDPPPRFCQRPNPPPGCPPRDGDDGDEPQFQGMPLQPVARLE
jgi:membrane peptidoglycan carboxypeptidase